MITGLFETHILVSDLKSSREFYDLFPGLQLARVEEARNCAFYWIGKEGEAMLGLWETRDKIKPQHFAFRCRPDAMPEQSVNFLKSKNIDCYNFLMDGTSRPMVFAWMPAISIYFRDPDNHELEFISMLPQKPRPELGVLSLEDWLKAQA
jgi:catechol 2,3-dioxygenase-like lactoylglutathione lyase family enzyme